MINLATIAATVGQAEARVAREETLKIEERRLKTEIASEQRALKGQKELTDYSEALKIEGNKRAQAWELQKMELTSQHNFAMDEQEYEIKRTRAFQEQLERDAIYDKRIKEFMETFKGALEDPNHSFHEAAIKAVEDFKSERAGMETKLSLVRPEQTKPIIPTNFQQMVMLEDMGFVAQPGVGYVPSPTEVPQPTVQGTIAGAPKITLTPGEIIGAPKIGPRREPQPIEVKTLEEFRALPKGTRYIDLDGVIETK